MPGIDEIRRILLANCQTHIPAKVKTGIFWLDKIGVPRGRITEIFGPSGKSSTLLKCMATCNQQGQPTALIDADHAFNQTWAEKIGVNPNLMLLNQPKSAEEAFFTLSTLIGLDQFDIIGLDSLTTLLPSKEATLPFSPDPNIEQVKLLNEFLAQTSSRLQKSKTALVITSHTRENIGTFGLIETTPGGAAIKIASALRIRTYCSGEIKNQENTTIGQFLNLEIIKNNHGSSHDKSCQPLIWTHPF
jgi:recombination protein RecA